MSIALCVEGVRFSYYGRSVLKDISLVVRKGDFIGLLGPNGSGKSTLLKILLGYLKPEGGSVKYVGLGTSPYQRTDLFVSFVPQQPMLHARFTVFDLILMGRLPHLKNRWEGYTSYDREKVSHVVSALSLNHLVDRPLSDLSGGELQKVIIARCLVQETPLMLLDEATSGLDINHSIEIMELMKEKAKKEGKTIIAVLHDLNLAAAYCDRLVFLKNGILQYEGDPSSVLVTEILKDVYGVCPRIVISEDGRRWVVPEIVSAKVKP